MVPPLRLLRPQGQVASQTKSNFRQIEESEYRFA